MTDVRQSGGTASDADDADVIALDLDRAVDMFEPPTVHLGSGHGTFQPGIDLCVAELEGQPTGRPVQIELMLPESEISDDLEERLAVTMRRYCDERSYKNTCHRRSTQRSGVRALRVGLPITLLGLAITAVAFHIGDSDDPQTAVVDIIGWVLAWLGLWYPSTSSSSTRATTCAKTARWRRCETRRSRSSRARSTTRARLPRRT
jgi:hypothetical protein